MNVLIAKQKDYNPEEVYSTVKKIFEDGELKDKLAGKQKILVKPNLLGPLHLRRQLQPTLLL